MKKKYKILILPFMLLLGLIVIVIVIGLNIRVNILNVKQQYIAEAKEYLKKKYSCEMNVLDEVIIGDRKSVKAYPVEMPEIAFYVMKGEYFLDTFLLASLRYEASSILEEVFSEYDCEIYVSELKWCNPTEDGNNETFGYLDNLYYNLGHIPKWENMNRYQKIEYAEIKINKKFKNKNELLKKIEELKDTGVQIETLKIMDITKKTYEYSI